VIVLILKERIQVRCCPIAQVNVNLVNVPCSTICLLALLLHQSHRFRESPVEGLSSFRSSILLCHVAPFAERAAIAD
jgi:hypothetical protein